MSVTELTEENFKKEVLESKGVVIVDFFAEWCGPCKMLAPIFEEAEAEAGEIAKFCKLNVDAVNKVASEYDVMSIPTLIIFKDGEEVKIGDDTDRLMGLQDKDSLIKKIKEYSK